MTIFKMFLKLKKRNFGVCRVKQYFCRTKMIDNTDEEFELNFMLLSWNSDLCQKDLIFRFHVFLNQKL